MELRYYLKVLFRHYLALALPVLLSIILAVGLSVTTMKKYEAKATCLVEPIVTIKDTVSANEMMNKVMPTLAEAVLSDTVLQNAATKLDSKFDLDYLRKNTTARVVAETFLIEISVKNENPKQTVEITNAVAESFTDFVNSDNVMGLNYRTMIAQAPVETQATTASHPVRNGILGGFLGLVLGVGLAMVVEYFDATVKTRNEAEAILERPVLAEIAPALPFGSENPAVFLKNPKIDESLRILRANIANVDSGEFRTILLTGLKSSAGASYICAGLAKAFAGTGRKTLLIDSDMSNSSSDDETGLVSFIECEVALDDICRSTAMENLKFLPAGKIETNQSDPYGSPKMRKALDKMRACFETIVILGCPVLTQCDSLTLAPLADATLLIVEIGKTTVADLQQGKELLDKPAIRLIGSVSWKTGKKFGE